MRALRPGRCASAAGLAVAAITVVLGGCAEAPPPAPRRPDVVLVVIDTLRPDHLGFGGHDHETAPFLATLARRSAVFTNAMSTSSWTVPATASLFTGLYPNRHGVLEGLLAHKERQEKQTAVGGETLHVSRIPDDVATVPERLRDGGYRCFGIAANFNIGAGFGFRRGFERFERLEPGAAGADSMHELVRQWSADITAQRPYFLYLHFNDPHFPYERHERHLRDRETTDVERLIAAYDSEIGHVDDYLARTAELLGWDDSTVVAVVSDHGEEFGEHGSFEHRALSLHGEVNRVLCLVAAPALGVRARHVPTHVGLADILPTLLELAQLPAAANLDGRSLLPLLLGEATESELVRGFEQRPLLAHRLEWAGDRQLWAVVDGRWKLIAGDAGDGVELLFDLAEDPAELHECGADHPEVVATLRAALAELRARATPGVPVDVTLDERDQTALRELGYVR